MDEFSAFILINKVMVTLHLASNGRNTNQGHIAIVRVPWDSTLGVSVAGN
jgi:hypothetical protein